MATILSFLLVLVRIGIMGLLLMGVRQLCRKNHKITKQTCVIILVITAIVISSVLFLLPLERWFITYSSPEEAFYLTERAQADLVLEGKESCFVIDKQGAGSKFSVYERVNGGWKKSKNLFPDRRTYSVSSGFFVYVYHVKDTNDYYLHVSMSLTHADQPSVHITDNRNSEFVVTENNEYYVYVDGWDNTYRLIIDDVAYKLIPLW